MNFWRYPDAHRPKSIQSPGFREDIQGIRALAVISVVAAHAGLPVPGGFVGVDVFFVVSGFVITQLFFREWIAQGRFRLRNFYWRRFTRLMPALALVVFATVTFSALILSPLGTQQNAVWTGIGSLFWVANVVIVVTTGDYFDEPAAQNPLLHVWSLSVEEQFYLFYPLLLIAGVGIVVRRSNPKLVAFLVTATVSAISLSLALIASSFDLPQVVEHLLGFYSPVARVWEFGVGALVAFAVNHPFRGLSSSEAAKIGFAGLSIIFASLWFIDESAIFPGPWTLLPVIGTAMLLISGTTPGNPSSRVLSMTPLVRIGDWSYSIYLWHWPLIVLLKYAWPAVEWVPVAAAVASLPLGAVSYRLVEQKFRNLPLGKRNYGLKLVAAVTLPPALMSGIVGVVAKDYWRPQYESGQVQIVHNGNVDWPSFYLELEERYFPCADQEIRSRALDFEGVTRCRQSLPSKQIDIVLLGDSHAEHLFLGFAEKYPNTNFAFYILNSLPIDDGESMSFFIDRVSTDTNVGTVVLNASWGSRGAPQQGLEETVNQLINSGKNLLIFDDVPIFPFDAKQCKFRISPLIPDSRCVTPRKFALANYETYAPTLRQLAETRAGVHFFETADFFCDEKDCDMRVVGTLGYRDNNHLNENGSRYFVDRLTKKYPSIGAFFQRSG
ncbi:acyltransferase family protein [Aquiluna sp.]|nr:acyltransferase family protein [Aquiluna sp.]